MSALSAEYRNVMDNSEWHVVYTHVRTVRPLMIRIQCGRDSKLMQLVSADAAGGWAVVKRRRVNQTSRKVYALLLNSEYIPLAGRPRRGGRFPAATAMAPWQHRWGSLPRGHSDVALAAPLARRAAPCRGRER